MFTSIFRSDVLVYYIALFIAFIGTTMMLVFVPFKSVATLMMMLSGLALVALGALLLLVMILADIRKKYVAKPYTSIYRED